MRSTGGISAARAGQLSELAEVLPGYSVGGRLEHDPSGSHQVVLSRHLSPGRPYKFSESDTFRITPERPARKYEVARGDVLFMSRGTRNVATMISEVPDPTIAPVSFYIVRPSPALDPAYLMWYLNQPTAQRAVTDVRTGAGTPIVQRTAFMELEIPLPDLEVQHTIGQIGIAMVREQQMLEQLTAATARLHDLTNERLARSLRAEQENGL